MDDVMIDTKKGGISLISLIITIIVIIILAAIVIFTGLNTPDRANFAKYVQEVSDVRTAILQEYANMKTQNAIENKTRSDAQIYYTMATGNEIDINDDTSTLKAGNVDELGFITVPDTLAGSEFYEVTDNEKIGGWSNSKGYYEPLGTEKHYITDKGEFFILPGYRVVEGDTTKWYVNESKYDVSDTPIRYTGTQDEKTMISFSIKVQDNDRDKGTFNYTCIEGSTWYQWASSSSEPLYVNPTAEECGYFDGSLQELILSDTNQEHGIFDSSSYCQLARNDRGSWELAKRGDEIVEGITYILDYYED